MSEEPEVNQEDSYSDIPASKKIIHEIIDNRNLPIRPRKTIKQDSEKDEKQSWLAEKSFEFFEHEKQRLVEQYPEYSSRIKNCESGYDIENLRQKILDDEGEPQPRKVAGKAMLPPANQEPSGLELASTHGSLINRLYKQSTVRTKTPEALKLKEEAIQKRDILFGNLKNISLDHMTKVLRESTHYVCPSCHSITSADLSRRGAKCECGHTVGVSKIKRRW